MEVNYPIYYVINNIFLFTKYFLVSSDILAISKKI